MTEPHHQYCSWCFKKTNHVLKERGVVSRHTYICEECENHTIPCRICDHMARGALRESQLKELDSKTKRLFGSWSDHLCAEHNGAIASFESLSIKLDDIDRYADIFIRKSVNVSRAAKYSAYGVVGAVAVGAIVVTSGGAAPMAAALGTTGALGAAGTGTAISTLSGAALTSASLAAIGGSMAAGTAIISATGAALGGIYGGVVANRYHSEDSSFKISALSEIDTDRRTIFINGFTEQLNETFEEWSVQQLSMDPVQKLYGVNWSSKTRLELGKTFAAGVGSKGALAMLKTIAKSGGKAAAKNLNLLMMLDTIADIAGNPWHTSMVRASQAGIQLAEALSRTNGKTFTLVGHSLGCRVIYYALEALATKNENFVANVILLGGAVGRDDNYGWRKACSAVSGTIFNCYSAKDTVLEHLYRTANARLSDPIGARPISLEDNQIVNIDCSDIVDSHFSWKPRYTDIINRIRNIHMGS